MILSTQKIKHWVLGGYFLLFAMLTGFTAQAATLNVNTTTLNASHNQRQITFNITSDISWTISDALDWVDNYSYTSGSGDKTVTLYLDPNTTLTARTGTITIAGTGVTAKTITITQGGVTADAFETNDLETNATSLNYVFNNDVATILIDSASIHSTTDVDYFKLTLPEGYTYKISTDLLDHSIDAGYSYKIDNGTFGSRVDQLEDFTVTQGSVYFKVVPYFSGYFGAYGLKIVITRGAGMPTLSATPTSIDLTTNASNTSLAITSNTKWNITPDGSEWLSLSSISGSNNGTITVSVEKNTGLYDRYASFTISANGTLSKTINVFQAGNNLPDDSYEANETEATAKELTVTFNGNTASVITNGAQISTTTDKDYYKINLPTLAAGSSYAVSGLLHDIAENSQLVNAKVSYKIGSSGSWSSYYNTSIPDFTFVGGDYVYFMVVPMWSDEKGAYSLDLTINKNTAAPTLTVSGTTLSLAANDNSTNTFTITSNSNWKVVSDAPWLTVSSGSGSGSGTVTITGLANVGSSNRTATLTISCPTVTSKTITVTQAGNGVPTVDSYEVNDTEAAAKELALTFTNDKASVKTTGSNIHSNTDLDYYKIQLPAGYTYSVSSQIYDYYNDEDGNYYSLDAEYYIKKGSSGTWSFYYDSQAPDFFIAGGDYIYFKTGPYYTNGKGNYALEVNITRAAGTPTLSVPTSDISLNALVGSSENLNITSTGTTWTVTSSAAWLSVGTPSGTGNASITLTATGNGGLEERQATVTISGNGVQTYIVYVYQKGSNINDDIYEQNNTEITAYPINIEYINNLGYFLTDGANINTSTDIDYYKVNLPTGYTYTISPTSYGESKISYKIGSTGTWSTPIYGSVSAFTVNGGSDIYFKEQPYNSGIKGYYDMDISIARRSVSLNASQETYNLTPAASTQTVNITSNVPWSVTSSQTWLTVSPASGTNNGSVTLTAAANPGNTTRSATVTITGGGITKTITVNQATSAVAALEVSPATLEVAAAANSTETFDITSNVAWTVSSSEAWLTANVTSGMNNAAITLTAAANTVITPRSATVTVTGSGITKTITVTQAGIAPVLTVSTETLNANAAANNTATFDITSNTSWTATSSETWLTVGTASGTGNANITLTASANESISTRTATVTVTGSNITRTITVTQAGAEPVLTVSRTTASIGAPANSTATFDITSNTTWTVTSSETWLTLSSASGSNNAAITLTAAANETTTARTATVTVTGSGITKTVAVTQTGKSMGTNDVEVSDGIKFYPNPVIDKLTIELEGKSVENRVMIYSEKGELKSDKTYNASNFDIEMSNLGAGVYFIKIVNAKESKTIKIVKKN